MLQDKMKHLWYTLFGNNLSIYTDKVITNQMSLSKKICSWQYIVITDLNFLSTNLFKTIYYLYNYGRT